MKRKTITIGSIRGYPIFITEGTGEEAFTNKNICECCYALKSKTILDFPNLNIEQKLFFFYDHHYLIRDFQSINHEKVNTTASKLYLKFLKEAQIYISENPNIYYRLFSYGLRSFIENEIEKYKEILNLQ